MNAENPVKGKMATSVGTHTVVCLSTFLSSTLSPPLLLIQSANIYETGAVPSIDLQVGKQWVSKLCLHPHEIYNLVGDGKMDTSSQK